MTDYKLILEKFVDDFRKECDRKLLYEEKIDKLNGQHEELIRKLDDLMSGFNSDKEKCNSFFIDNSQFMKLMNISRRTAQQWRDNNVISYSQIGNKIFYQIPDIQHLLQQNYVRARKEVTK